MQIRDGDLITLRHAELDGFLSANIAYMSKEPELFISIYKGSFPLERLSAMSVWQVENSNGLHAKG